MLSMATEDVTSLDSVIPKTESLQEDYTPSSPSSQGEGEASISTELTATDPPPVPKRKGGRKPIYATSEERKQRNRQAQAAFRERRTEYIKQLEKTIEHHEETLQNLQQSHRTAADECLMLRYKNSLLERVLLEKGIDVQAELRLKGSPQLKPFRHNSGSTSQASPMQKAMLNRQQARQRPVLAPPIQTQTPPSQQSSPSAMRSPGFAVPGNMASPTGDLQNQAQHTAAPMAQNPPRPVSQLLQNHFAPQSRSHVRSVSATTPQTYTQPLRAMQQNYYSTPFQKAYNQLDQDYEAQNDMLDDGDGDGDEMDAEGFIPNFRLPPTNEGMAMGMQISPPTTASAASDSGGTGGHAISFDYDPMLDADPFGLTASMHFPNPYAYSATRR